MAAKVINQIFFKYLILFIYALLGAKTTVIFRTEHCILHDIVD